MDDTAVPSLEPLYGPGHGEVAVDPRDSRFEPLFMAIEKSILAYWNQADNPPTGGGIELDLNDLARNPSKCPPNPLARAVTRALAEFLPGKNYSGLEVRTALRAVLRSVARHTRDGGKHAYINFIRRFMR